MLSAGDTSCLNNRLNRSCTDCPACAPWPKIHPLCSALRRPKMVFPENAAEASYIRGHVDVSPRRLDGDFLPEWVIIQSEARWHCW